MTPAARSTPSSPNADKRERSLRAVTPFGIINDGNGLVTVVLEERVLGCEMLNFHPLRNDATATIARDDFSRFLEAQGHKPIIVRLG